MHPHRPDITQASSANTYVADMLEWCKKNIPGFSVRRETKELTRCSATLVTLIAKGKREVAPDRVDDLEKKSFEDLVLLKTPKNRTHRSITQKFLSPEKRAAQQRPLISQTLYSPWYHLYIWESVKLKQFLPDPIHLTQLLPRITSLEGAGKALRKLSAFGFLRKNIHGKLESHVPHVASTDEIPSPLIQRLHQKSLMHAANTLPHIPLSERESGLVLVLLTLNQQSFEELKVMIKKFTEDVMQFAESKNKDSERLYQVTLHAIPVSSVLPEKKLKNRGK